MGHLTFQQFIETKVVGEDGIIHYMDSAFMVQDMEGVSDWEHARYYIELLIVKGHSSRTDGMCSDSLKEIETFIHSNIRRGLV